MIQHDFSEALNPDGDFTLTLWAKSNGGAGAWNSPVTSRHDLVNEGETSQGYLIYDAQGSGVWTFWSGNGDDPGNWQTLNGPEVELGNWEHVAITYDDTAQMKGLYINGELAAESNDSIQPNDTTPFNIGAGQDFGDGFWFDGEIDDIGLWGAGSPKTKSSKSWNWALKLWPPAPRMFCSRLTLAKSYLKESNSWESARCEKKVGSMTVAT